MARRWIRWGVGIACCAFFAMALMIAQVQWSEVAHIRSARQVDEAPVAIILGASVKQDGTASDALTDRVMTGVELYKSGKVRKLLMTGDDGRFHVDEVSAMKKLALDQGMPQTDVLVDGHGYRTYESCKRAARVYDINKAVIVTQRFHLGRALYLCAFFGMDAQGVAADLHRYRRILFFTLRELGASVKAWWDINIKEPKPPVDSGMENT